MILQTFQQEDAVVVIRSTKHSKQFLNEKPRKFSSLDMENYSRKKQLGENILYQKMIQNQKKKKKD